MTRNQKIRRVAQLRAEGLTFRQIEARLYKTLGCTASANGTIAYRLFQKAQTKVAPDAVLNHSRKQVA